MSFPAFVIDQGDESLFGTYYENTCDREPTRPFRILDAAGNLLVSGRVSPGPMAGTPQAPSAVLGTWAAIRLEAARVEVELIGADPSPAPAVPRGEAEQGVGGP